jgi:hypothetical protein
MKRETDIHVDALKTAMSHMCRLQDSLIALTDAAETASEVLNETGIMRCLDAAAILENAIRKARVNV